MTFHLADYHMVAFFLYDNPSEDSHIRDNTI